MQGVNCTRHYPYLNEEVLHLVHRPVDSVVVALVGDVVLASRPCWLHVTKEGGLWCLLRSCFGPLESSTSVSGIIHSTSLGTAFFKDSRVKGPLHFSRPIPLRLLVIPHLSLQGILTLQRSLDWGGRSLPTFKKDLLKASALHYGLYSTKLTGYDTI